MKPPLSGSDLTDSGFGQCLNIVCGRACVQEPRSTDNPHKTNLLKPASPCKVWSSISCETSYNAKPVSAPLPNMPQLIPLSKLAERKASTICNKHTQKSITSNINYSESQFGCEYINVRIPTAKLMSCVNDDDWLLLPFANDGDVTLLSYINNDRDATLLPYFPDGNACETGSCPTGTPTTAGCCIAAADCDGDQDVANADLFEPLVNTMTCHKLSKQVGPAPEKYKNYKNTEKDISCNDRLTPDECHQIIIDSDTDADFDDKETEQTSGAKKVNEVSGPISLPELSVEDDDVMRCWSDYSPVEMSTSPKNDTAKEYPPELNAALLGILDYGGVDVLETELTESFKNSTHHCWREGRVKSSFVYLLLDPRITQNLPHRARNLDETEAFQTFIRAIFYVGKGKRGRTHDHLYSALSHMNRPGPKVKGNVQYIVDIWKSHLGVVSIQCYQNTIAVEAYTREACIIDAIDVSNLTNKKRGVCYGQALAWSREIRRVFGVHLLRRALQIFLSEGERQIGPMDIKH